MIPAHYQTELERQFPDLTPREKEIYQMGLNHGQDIKADECQLTISRLEMDRAKFNGVGLIS